MIGMVISEDRGRFLLQPQGTTSWTDRVWVAKESATVIDLDTLDMKFVYINDLKDDYEE